jgi:hypothetical protein
MKTTLFAIFFLCLTFFTVNAQDTIPNGSFDYWSTMSFLQPTNYPTSSNLKSFQNSHVANVVQATNAYHGTYAVKLITEAPVAPAVDTTGGYISNSTNVDKGDPTTWTGGIPYTQIPTGIRGYYTYNVNMADSALVGIVFRKNGVNYANYFYSVGGIHSTYTPFSFTFIPALTQAPDSIIFVATSSNLLVFNGLPGSTVKFDSISFTGVTSQPALMNGDFESWTNYNAYPTLNDWDTQGNLNTAVFQTTDTNTGKYALELMTVAGSSGKNSGTFQLNVGNVQDGQWNNGTNTFAGGFPYNQQNGTLTFYYKYTPANPKDSAIININLKLAGSNVGGYGMTLPAASSYTYVEMPFSGNQVPDSAMIQISSSKWQGTTWQDTAKSYVGAVLKIDGLAFKPSTTGITETSAGANITFYPNPMKETGVFDIPAQTDLTGMNLRIYNEVGVTVKSIPVNANKVFLNKGDLLPGVYYYEFLQGSTLVKQGKIIVE